MRRLFYGLGALLSGTGMVYGAYVVYISIGLWGTLDTEEDDIRTVPYLLTLMGVLLLGLTRGMVWYFCTLLRRKDRE